MFIRIKIEITSTGYLPYFLMQKYKITGKEKKVYQNNDTPSVCLPRLFHLKMLGIFKVYD